MEHWKSIEGYEGLYEIGDLGRVKSLRYGKTKILRPSLQTQGYRQVPLRKNGILKRHKVAILVATAFVYKPPKRPLVVNHLDGCKTNDRMSNLEWCSYAENSQHAIRLGLIKPKEYCKRGHLRSRENLYRYNCRKCGHIRDRKFYQKKKSLHV